MPQPDVALMTPLLVGLGTIICTLPINAAGMSAILVFFRREKGRGIAGARFFNNIVVLSAVVLIALVAHLGQIAAWAFVFKLCGQFSRFSTAFYHSAVNYTTLGYGDIVMSDRWRLLGPLEAADGMLMFGVSIAVLFGVVTQLIQLRLHIDAH